MSSPAHSAPRGIKRRTLVAACVGNAIEFYDLAVYGFVAAYMGKLFFPTGDPTTELLASFAVFGLTYFVRPIGGLFLGSLSDRIGRKPMLVLVLVLMAIGTAGIGLLPTYAAIGIAAPILLVLLRCVQSVSAGGEVGSVVSFVLEHTGEGHRGKAIAWLMSACVLGFVGGAAVATGVGALVGEAAMLSWGWRVPFLIAAPLGAIGLYIRMKLEETPEFLAVVERKTVATAPVREAFSSWRRLIAGLGVGAMHQATFYIVMTFMATFITTVLERGATIAFWGSMSAGLVAMAVLPVAGSLSDRIGRKPVVMAGAVLFIIFSVPLFLVIENGSALAVVLGQGCFGVILGVAVSATLPALTETYPTRIRATGVSISINIPGALFGGTAPFVATWLIDWTGMLIAPAFYLMLVATVGLIGIIALPPAVVSEQPSPAPERERAPSVGRFEPTG